MDITLRINEINPVHTRLSLFCSGKRYGIETTSRGLSGDLCIDTETVLDFIERLQPNRITLRDNIDASSISWPNVSNVDFNLDFIITYNIRQGNLAGSEQS